jgi:hypothetical protein
VGEASSRSVRVGLTALWAGLLVQLLGGLLDARWHATHDEFEGASEQLEAHWLLWIGVLATLAVAAWAIWRRVRPGPLGYLVVLTGAAAYVSVSVWHFIEHANGSDPELAHVLLAISQAAMLTGAIVATLAGLRARGPGGARPSAST